MNFIKFTDSYGQDVLVNEAQVSEVKVSEHMLVMSSGTSYSVPEDILRQVVERLDVTDLAVKKKPYARPKSLAEACKVSEDAGRIVLTLKEGVTGDMVRQWLAVDIYERFEFDGQSMYCYEKKDGKKAAWSFSCGPAGFTLVADSVSKMARAVKSEMKRQCIEKGFSYKEYNL